MISLFLLDILQLNQADNLDSTRFRTCKSYANCLKSLVYCIFVKHFDSTHIASTHIAARPEVLWVKLILVNKSGSEGGVEALYFPLQ